MRRSAPAVRWAGAGIPLNAVAPGVVATPMTQYRLDDPSRREALLGVVPMPLQRGAREGRLAVDEDALAAHDGAERGFDRPGAGDVGGAGDEHQVDVGLSSRAEDP